MAENLKAIIVELTAGNVRNHHLYVRDAFGFFPSDCLGGSNAESAGSPIDLIVGNETVTTDIDQTKGIFRERGAIRRFFEEQSIVEGDLVVIERISTRRYQIFKTSKRAFKYHL